MKVFKKITIVFIFVFLFFSLFNISLNNNVLALENENKQIKRTFVDGFFDNVISANYYDKGVPSNNDEIWVIIKLKSFSIVDYLKQNDSSIELNAFLNSEEGSLMVDAMLAEQEKVKKELETLVDISFKYSYTTIINGFSAKIKYGDYNKIASISEIDDVIYSYDYTLPNEVASTFYEINTSVINNELNNDSYLGDGMLIGVVDSGLQTTHEAFKVLPKEQKLKKDDVSNLLEKTFAYQSMQNELMLEDVYINEKVPFAFDYSENDADVNPNLEMMDESGSDHGTHVAGIVCGNNGSDFLGAAPNAQLAVFKVFSDSKSGASSVDIVAALNDAILLGVDVVNLSLGTPCGFSIEANTSNYQDIFNAVNDAGISVVCAAGNQYSAGYGTSYQYGNTDWLDQGTVSSPSSYVNSFAVASFDGANVIEKVFNIDGKEFVYNDAIINSLTNELGDFSSALLGEDNDSSSFELVDVGLGRIEDFNDIDVFGKIALIKRGSLPFTQKVLNAASFGASGVIIYNNVFGSNMNVVVEGASIPSCSISLDDALDILNNKCQMLTIKKDYERASNKISDFSSFGPGCDLSIKPEITSLGGNIYSSIPNVSSDGYGVMSGTSMSSPDVAGKVAVIRQYLKAVRPSLSNIKLANLAYQVLMSTANPIINPDNQTFYSPRLQGAGLIDIDKALTAPSYLYVKSNQKTKLELGDDKTRTGKYEMSFVLSNLSSKELSYKLDIEVLTTLLKNDNYSLDKSSLNIDDYTVSFTNDLGEKFTDDIVMVSPNEEIVINVSLNLGEKIKKYLNNHYLHGTYIDGFIRLYSNNNDEINLGIPYLAFFGDWDGAPIFDGYLFDEEKIVITSSLSSLSNDGKTISELGVYQHELIDGYQMPIITKDHLSISTLNKSGLYNLYSLNLGLLRNAEKITYELYDAATNTLLDEESDFYVRKAYYDFKKNTYSPVVLYLMLSTEYANNTHLLLKIKANNGNDINLQNTNNEYIYDFYIDNEMPRIIQKNEQLVNYEFLDGKTYLEFNAYDNHFLQSFSLFDSLGNNLTGHIPFYGDMNQEITVKYDITDLIAKLPDNKLIICLDDYALNKVMYETEIDLIKANEIYFTKNEYQLFIGESIKLDYVINPLNAYLDFNTLECCVLDSEVASISNKLVITGEKVGTTKVMIEVETLDGTKLSCEATVNVLENLSEKNFIKINNDQDLVMVGEFLKLEIETNLSDLSNIVYESDNLEIASILETGEILFTKTGKVTIFVTLNGISSYMTFIVKENDQDFVIVDGELISYIGDDVDVVIPSTVKVIKEYAFKDTLIETVVIPSSVSQIEIGSFKDCKYLYKVVLNTRKAIKWPLSSENREKVFSGCNNVAIESVEDGYYNCSTDGIIYSHNYSKIEYVIDEMVIDTDFVMNELVLEVAPYAFANISFNSFTFNNRIQIIKEYAFMNSLSVDKLDLPDSIEVLYYGAFLNCTDILIVNLPKSLKTIPGYSYGINNCYDQVFGGCTSLEEYNISKENAYFKTIDGVLYNKEETILYSCPINKKISKYELIDGVKRIMMNAFRENLSLEEVVFPSSLEVIGDKAFYGCTNLCKVSFLSKKAPVLEQNEISYDEFNSSVNCYANFVDSVYTSMYDNSYQKGLSIFVMENANGYDDLIYQQIFESKCFISSEVITKLDNVVLKQEEEKIIISFDKSLFNVEYHIYRCLNDGEYVYLETTKNNYYLDDTAYGICCNYSYKIVVSYQDDVVDYSYISMPYSIYKEPSSEESYLFEIIKNILIIKEKNDSTVNSLIEETYLSYDSLSQFEKEQIVIGEDFEKIYDNYSRAKEFDDGVKTLSRPKLLEYLEFLVKDIDNIYNSLEGDVKKYVSTLDIIEEFREDLDICKWYIDELETFGEVTVERLEDINNLKAAYHDLSSYQQFLLNDIYLTKITLLETNYQMAYNAFNVTKKIKLLDENSTKIKVDKVLDEYNALSEEEKALIPSELVEKLEYLSNNIKPQPLSCVGLSNSLMLFLFSSLSLFIVLLRKKR